MFWNYLIGFAAASVGIYFFLALVGSEVLAQLVLFLVGIAALAGLATVSSRLKEHSEQLSRLEEKVDRLLREQSQPENSTSPDEHEL